MLPRMASSRAGTNKYNPVCEHRNEQLSSGFSHCAPAVVSKPQVQLHAAIMTHQAQCALPLLLIFTSQTCAVFCRASEINANGIAGSLCAGAD